MTAVTYGKSGHVVEAPVVEAPEPGTVRITIKLDPSALVRAGGRETLHRMLDEQIERAIEDHIVIKTKPERSIGSAVVNGERTYSRVTFTVESA